MHFIAVKCLVYEKKADNYVLILKIVKKKSIRHIFIFLFFKPYKVEKTISFGNAVNAHSAIENEIRCPPRSQKLLFGGSHPLFEREERSGTNC